MNNLRRLWKLKSSSRGQSLVEFAMVLPMLLVVAFMITEFGRALWIKNVMSQAAREGCRVAVTAFVANDAKVATAEEAAGAFLDSLGMGPSSSTPPTIEGSSTKIAGFDYVTLTITQNFNFVMGGPISPSPGANKDFIDLATFPIAAIAVMKYE